MLIKKKKNNSQQKIDLQMKKPQKKIRKNFGQIHHLKILSDKYQIRTKQIHGQLYVKSDKPLFRKFSHHQLLLVKQCLLVTILQCYSKIIHIDFKLIEFINIFIINLLRFSQKLNVQLQSKDQGYGNKYKQIGLLDSRSQTIFQGKRQKNGRIIISGYGRNFIT